MICKRNRRAILVIVCIAIASPAFAAAPGPESMLKGDSLDGWKSFGGANWTVRDRGIEASGGGGVLLFTEPLTDYVFECEFKVSKGRNGGIYVRSNPESKSQHPRYEIQIWDNPKAVGHRTGDFLYVHMARTFASTPAEWNRLRLTSVGPRHQAVLNGTLVFDLLDFRNLRGCLALQAHSGGAKEPYIWYRSPRLRRLPNGNWPWPSDLSRILVLMSKSDRPGHAHDRIGSAIETALADANRYAVTWAADPRALDPPHIAGYDTIVLHGPDAKQRTRWLNAERRQRLAEHVRNGAGLIVLHGTFTGGKDGWTEFPNLAGGAWRADERGAAKGSDLVVRPLPQAHPILKGLAPFQVEDDIRRMAGSLKPSATPLLTLDRGGERHVIAWAASAGKGRVVCASLGGTAKALGNPYVRRFLVNACDWVSQR